jgi:predicted branched-subunit amino acid permease
MPVASGGARRMLRAGDLAAYRAGARAVLPLVAVIAVLGVLFGYLARSAGLSPVAATVMSATTFSGSAQFAAVSILAVGGTPGAAVGTAALLNTRYAATGAALAPALRGGALRRFVLAQLAVDESWAVAYVGDGRFSEERLVGAGLVLYVAHVGSTALGALGGQFVGDPAAWGLDAALPALFVLLAWPHLRRSDGRRAALLGAAVALALTPLTPPGVPIIAAAAASLVGRRPPAPA